MLLGWATGIIFSHRFSFRALISPSLMNDRFGKGKGADRKKVTTAGIHRINHATGETVGWTCSL
jgi:hypothetical protein